MCIECCRAAGLWLDGQALLDMLSEDAESGTVLALQCSTLVGLWGCAVYRATQHQQEHDAARSTDSASMSANGSTERTEGGSAAPQGTTYRVASLGQDCHICMWDVTVPEPAASRPTARQAIMCWHMLHAQTT